MVLFAPHAAFFGVVLTLLKQKPSAKLAYLAAEFLKKDLHSKPVPPEMARFPAISCGV